MRGVVRNLAMVISPNKGDTLVTPHADYLTPIAIDKGDQPTGLHSPHFIACADGC